MKYRNPLISLAWAAGVIISIFLLPRLIGLDSPDGGIYAGFQQDLNARLSSAIKIFALTKVIAGTLSFLQNLQIDLSVVVAGLSVTPLSVLEPISYTLNIVSNLFLFAIGAIILEKVLVTAGSLLALKLLFPLTFALAGISIWITGTWKVHLRKASVYMGLISFVVWLSIPLSIGFANLLDRYFLAEMNEAAAKNLEERTEKITLAEKNLADPETIISPENTGGWFNNAIDRINIKRIRNKITAAAAGVAESAKSAVEDMMRLFTSFIVTTVLVPIVTILILWFFLKKLLIE
jgi:hypothetical protein